MPLNGADGAGTLRPAAATTLCSDYLFLCWDMFIIRLQLIGIDLFVHVDTYTFRGLGTKKTDTSQHEFFFFIL